MAKANVGLGLRVRVHPEGFTLNDTLNQRAIIYASLNNIFTLPFISSHRGLIGVGLLNRVKILSNNNIMGLFNLGSDYGR